MTKLLYRHNTPAAIWAWLRELADLVEFRQDVRGLLFDVADTEQDGRHHVTVTLKFSVPFALKRERDGHD